LNPRLSATELVRQRSTTPAGVAVALAAVSCSSLCEDPVWPVFGPADLLGAFARVKAKTWLEMTTAKETENASRRLARPKRKEQHFIFALIWNRDD